MNEITDIVCCKSCHVFGFVGVFVIQCSADVQILLFGPPEMYRSPVQPFLLVPLSLAVNHRRILRHLTPKVESPDSGDIGGETLQRHEQKQEH